MLGQKVARAQPPPETPVYSWTHSKTIQSSTFATPPLFSVMRALNSEAKKKEKKLEYYTIAPSVIKVCGGLR